MNSSGQKIKWIKKSFGYFEKIFQASIFYKFLYLKNTYKLGEPYWIRKGEKPIHKYPYLEELKVSLNAYREVLNAEINSEISMKKNNLIDKIQSFLKKDGDLDFKKALQQEKKDFLLFFLKTLYINEKKKDHFSFHNMHLSLLKIFSVIFFFINEY